MLVPSGVLSNGKSRAARGRWSKLPVDRDDALRGCLAASWRTCAVVVRRICSDLLVIPARAMPQLRYQRQDLLEHLSRHRDLDHLERDIAAVADDLRADQFLIFEIAPARSATEQQYALRFTRLGGSIAPQPAIRIRH